MKRIGWIIAMLLFNISHVDPDEVRAKEMENGEPFRLTILHTNDVHSHLENVPYLHTAIKEERKKDGDALLLDAGDVFSGTLFFNEYLGQADAAFMNEIGYDAMTLGNHEFDKGSEVLADFIRKLSFPVVSGNVDVRLDPHLAPIMKSEIPEQAESGNIYPSIIQTVKGIKIGIIGLTTEDTAFLSAPDKKIVFQDAEKKVLEEMTKLEAKGVNHIILLSHLGLRQDKMLAQKVKGIDIIVGGHSHTRLESPLVYNMKSEPTLIVQADEYGKSLGKLTAVFSDRGVLTGWNGELLDVLGKNQIGNDVYPPDPWAVNRLEQLRGPIEKVKSMEVGTTNISLNGNRRDVRTKETNLGNLITDAMLEKANQFNPTQIAFQNGGGIRNSISAGTITLGDVLGVLPFGNTLVTLNLTGEEILLALEHSVANVDGEAGQFLQVSGMTYHFDPSKTIGNRITEVKIQGAPLDRSKMYGVAVNAFLAGGGDGFTVLRNAKDNGRISDLHLNLYEVMSEYLTTHSPVSPQVEGRIVKEKE
ncbi:5'-nucleotidase C-terminal domain-containing protein [Rossellomorea vietnamensis]|uniref:bifunctional metallophosphatase/5'-nucleotidase n=1 Tax=Rossellomorea vietnamensis TaxID=218284 RepID=UPI001CCF3D1A|nr:5'-nucleotidase C-terminal domain-containing protein [Rossellomorea vietnamensis]MCA0147391.1 5'-nucleotidase C-terminal domain-containing protein [Rossellomorea vietnamensis]